MDFYLVDPTDAPFPAAMRGDLRPSASFTASSDDRRHLQRTVADRNQTQKQAWRTRIIPLTDQGLGTRAAGQTRHCL